MTPVSYGTILEHHLAVVAIRQSVIYTQIITVIIYCELVGLGWFHVQTVGAYQCLFTVVSFGLNAADTRTGSAWRHRHVGQVIVGSRGPAGG